MLVYHRPENHQRVKYVHFKITIKYNIEVFLFFRRYYQELSGSW